MSSVGAREEKQEWNNRAFSHSEMKNSTELKYSLSYCWPAGSHSSALWALFNKKSTWALSPGHYNGKMWEYWKERDGIHWAVEVVADYLDNHVTLNPYSFCFLQSLKEEAPVQRRKGLFTWHQENSVICRDWREETALCIWEADNWAVEGKLDLIEQQQVKRAGHSHTGLSTQTEGFRVV